MFKNIIDLIEKLKTEEECINLFIQLRWKDEKVKCPFKECKKEGKIYHFKDGKRFECSCCGKLFSYKTGSIMENTKIAVKKWFIAIYLHTSHKKGISSVQLSKDLSITQKTAWFMLQRIREVMKNDFNQFDGVNEIDEAYLGGSDSNKHSNQKGKKDKMAVIGIVNRDTKQVKAFKVPSAEKENLLPRVNMNIKAGATIISDTFQGYKDLKKHYDHSTVKHSAGEYVKNDSRKAYKIHTNTIEGFWSQLKRGINGVYHWVSDKHIQKYCNEFSFRYNTREMKEFERFDFFFNKVEMRLDYATLIK